MMINNKDLKRKKKRSNMMTQIYSEFPLGIICYKKNRMNKKQKTKTKKKKN